MSYNFDKDFEYALKQKIETELKNGAHPFAAFDADGTLWATDMGESFFRYQFENNLLNDLPENPWDFYTKFHSTQPEAAYLWLAQINKGQPLEQVRKWAKQCAENHSQLGLFTGQKNLINFLQQLGVEVYVVTASIKWAVEPAAEYVGIPKENVLGIQTQIIEGVISEQQEGPITYKEGKIEALLKVSQGKPPFFVSGNSSGDLPLLEASTHLRLVVSSASPNSHMFNVEQEMINIARERNWYHYRF